MNVVKIFFGKSLLHAFLMKSYGLIAPKQDISAKFDFISHAPFGVLYSDSNPPCNTVNWFVPPIGYGSGGHLNIIRFIKLLESDGFESRIIVTNEFRAYDSKKISSQIAAWFAPVKAKVYLHPQEEIPAAHIAVATGWQTAYPVKNFLGSAHKFYFIQDYEPFFYPLGTEYFLAEDTYRFGFTGIALGSWLAATLHEQYGMRMHEIGFSYDEDLYMPQPASSSPGPKQLLFYARPETPRRAFDLGILALSAVKEHIPSVEIILVGGDLGRYRLPFSFKNYGRLPIAELPRLYSRCDAALVLSMTNLSLLPLEIMACGCPVISNCGPNVEWMLNETNCKLSPPTVSSLAEAIIAVISDEHERNRLIDNGLDYARSTSWQREADKVAKIFRKTCNY